MRVIIAGCRNVKFPQAEDLVAAAMKDSGWWVDTTEIIHGGAAGIDQAAGRYFDGCFPIKVFEADWNKHGMGAGPIRNRNMAENADALIAIWDGKSRGTKSMIEIASKKGLKVHIHMIGSGDDEEHKERSDG